MKKYSILVNFVLILFLSTNSLAQVAINPNGDSPDASAMLDVVSTTKGVLIPRMTKANRDDISNPATGLMIFQTDNTPGYYYYTGSGWGLIGAEALTVNDLMDAISDGSSVFIGSNAGSSDDGSNSCVALGLYSLNKNTSGTVNTAVGYYALKNNTTGSANVAIGKGALYSNGSGIRNTATGLDALYTNYGGTNNTAYGYAALKQSTTPYNSAFGSMALRYNLTGNRNIAFGYSSLFNNTEGSDNIGIGVSALNRNTTGNANIALGFEADYYNLQGSNNTIIGYQAGKLVTTHNKHGSVFIGYQAGFYESSSNKLYIENTNSSSPLIYGEFDNNLLKVNGELAIANGTSSGSIKLYESSTYGTNFTKFQTNYYQATDITYTLPIADGTTGQVLQTNGGGVLSWNDDGGATSINGLSDGKTGGYSVFLGSNAGAVDDGTDNMNVAVGNEAFNKNTSGFENTAVGYMALYANTIGVKNVSIGRGANGFNQEGSFNTMIGHVAGGGPLYSNRSFNIFIGYAAGYNETGDHKLYIESSTSSSPLIYGEFDNDLVRINGDLEVTGSINIGIDGLSDGKTGGNSVFLGSNAGAVDDASDNKNVGVGIDVLKSNTTGYYNSAFGYTALYSNTTGNHNTAVGREAMYHNTIGGSNTATGVGSLYSNTIGFNNTANGLASLYSNASGDYNTANGEYALYSNTVGNKNVGVGFSANSYNQEGSNNTIIGYEAGRGVTNHNKSGNILLGYQAGYSETSDNKLYIENSNSTTPLIYGNFDTDVVTIYGNLGVGTWVFGNGTNTFSLINGTAPNASISDGILLYAEDVTSSELKVRDEAGNITTLSPHNFSITTKSEPMAWSYYSENAATGQVINVDMLRAVRLIEKFTGEKLAFIENVEEDVADVNSEENTIGIIQQQQQEIDKLKLLNTELISRIEKLENNNTN